MAVIKEVKDGCAFLTITDTLSIYEVEELSKTMQESLEQYNGLILKLNQVEECDTAGIQLLLSARKTAEKAGKGFEIDGASPELIRVATLLGLNPEALF